jgi:hypothetical protein
LIASCKVKVRGAPELGEPELGEPELGALELGALELGALELGALELGALELGALELWFTASTALGCWATAKAINKAGSPARSPLSIILVPDRNNSGRNIADRKINVRFINLFLQWS